MSFRHSLTIASIDIFPVRATGGVSPNMALGQMPTRPALLVRITDRQGCFGWGEIWANFPPRANFHKAHIVEDVIAPHLKRLKFTDPREVETFLRRTLATYFLHIGQRSVFEHLLAGIDVALWDLALRSAGQTFAEHMGLTETSAKTYASSINPEDLACTLKSHSDLGQTRFKLKLGFDNESDLAFVRKAASMHPPGSRLMVDNNQTWDLSQAREMLNSLEEFDLLFAEEPMRADSDISDWEQLANATSIPLAGGENLYGVDNFLRMSNAGLRFLQPDVAKWGGISGALALAEALPSGIALWPHFMGTAIGQMAALSVAAAIGEESTCEMDVNTNPLRLDLCGDILAISDGRVALSSTPGLVTPPNSECLAEFKEPE